MPDAMTTSGAAGAPTEITFTLGSHIMLSHDHNLVPMDAADTLGLGPSVKEVERWFLDLGYERTVVGQFASGAGPRHVPQAFCRCVLHFNHHGFFSSTIFSSPDRPVPIAGARQRASGSFGAPSYRIGLVCRTFDAPHEKFAAVLGGHPQSRFGLLPHGQRRCLSAEFGRAGEQGHIRMSKDEYASNMFEHTRRRCGGMPLYP